MASCNDCIHLEACCGFMPFDATEEEKVSFLDEIIKKPCTEFKNKADVVEVVRCRDCKYYAADEHRCDHPQFDYEGHCYDFWINAKPDDFCSYGERRETE